ncbi:MAG: phytase [bacterium]|nr:phytase [bacterium]
MKKIVVSLFLLIACISIVSAQSAIGVPVSLESDYSPGDGASSPVVWVHPTDSAMSVFIGTDDNEGIGVYDLSGKLLQFLDDDAIGQADLRYDFPVGDTTTTLVVGGVADRRKIVFYTINPDTRELIEINTFDIGVPTAAVCMYRSPVTGGFYAFIISEGGEAEQYLLTADENGAIIGELRREFQVGGEVESCTVDDDYSRLYIGEGEVAVWQYGAEPESGISRRLVDISGGNIFDEIEGITIYRASEGQGYVLVANEQANSILVYERSGENAFVGEFSLTEANGVDGISEPAGIYAMSAPLGDAFPNGVFITTDDVNETETGTANTNYKLADWGAIASALSLITDTSYNPRSIATTDMITVPATIETEPVQAGIDAADDPAIWIHPTDPNLSLIIGTDKTPQGGLVTYNLDGTIQQKVAIGRVNNVDLRYNFPLGGELVTIVVGTNRTENNIAVLKINPDTRTLENVAARSIVSDTQEVYGICMYHSPITGEFYAFPNSVDGVIEQYRLFDNGSGLVDAELVRTLSVESQPEGCVADDELGFLYIGEEKVGIWKFYAEPDQSSDFILQVAVTDGNPLTADAEGLAIYYAQNGAGYLLASSQGSSEFVVYDRAGDNALIGVFSVIEGGNADGISGTDGIDVTNFPLGDAFPTGVFVAQDDLNINPDDNQNFKLVSWGDIASALGLAVDVTFDPRTIGE